MITTAWRDHERSPIGSHAVKSTAPLEIFNPHKYREEEKRDIRDGTYFSSNGISKNPTPSLITLSVNSSGIPTFFKYKNPTSSNACLSSSRNLGFVSGSRASERSRMGIELNDDILGFVCTDAGVVRSCHQATRTI